MVYDDLLFAPGEAHCIIEGTIGALNSPTDFLTDRYSSYVMEAVGGIIGILNSPVDFLSDKQSTDVIEIPLGSLNTPIDIVYEHSELCYELIGLPTDYAF